MGVLKCKNLRIDPHGNLDCKSSHICYRSVCYSNIFETVIHKNGHLVWK